MPQDWTNKLQVLRYAKQLGNGLTVFFDNATGYYGICHTVRESERLAIGLREVIHRT